MRAAAAHMLFLAKRAKGARTPGLIQNRSEAVAAACLTDRCTEECQDRCSERCHSSSDHTRRPSTSRCTLTLGFKQVALALAGLGDPDTCIDAALDASMAEEALAAASAATTC